MAPQTDTNYICGLNISYLNFAFFAFLICEQDVMLESTLLSKLFRKRYFSTVKDIDMYKNIDMYNYASEHIYCRKLKNIPLQSEESTFKSTF